MCVELQRERGGGGGGERELFDAVRAGSGVGEADDAVRARCGEALQIRNDLENRGVWKWARDRAKVLEREQEGSVGLVKRMLEGRNGGVGEETEMTAEVRDLRAVSEE